jgi:hypothetical protein
MCFDQNLRVLPETSNIKRATIKGGKLIHGWLVLGLSRTAVTRWRKLAVAVSICLIIGLAMAIQLKMPLLTVVGLVLVMASAIPVVYFFSLDKNESNLRIDNDGIIDSSSLLRLGRLSLQEVVSIRCVRYWGILCLRADLSSAAPIRRARGWRALFVEPHLLTVGSCLLFPLFYFDFDGPQLNKFLRSWRETRRKLVPQKGSRELPVKPDMFVGRTQRKENPLDSTQSHVVKRVDQIKSEISSNQWDLMLIELFCDFVRYFPERRRGETVAALRIPSSVQEISEEQAQGLERVGFVLSGQPVEFELRQNEDMSGFLTVSYSGVEVFQLRVEVEIGTLEPIDVEKFVQRSMWLAPLSELATELGYRRGAVERSQGLPGAKIEDWQSLKRNFGLE